MKMCRIYMEKERITFGDKVVRSFFIQKLQKYLYFLNIK